MLREKQKQSNAVTHIHLSFFVPLTPLSDRDGERERERERKIEREREKERERERERKRERERERESQGVFNTIVVFASGLNNH